MRLDYTLYILGVVLFIVTAALFFLITGQNERIIYMIVTVTLGAVSVIAGYCMTPKAKVTAAVQQPVAPVTPEVVPPAPQQAPVAEKPVVVTPKVPAPTAKDEPESELTQIRGISKVRADQLKANGINSIKALAEASPIDLAAKLEVSPKIVKMWIGTAKKLVK
jgi:predicted flap endonuclease-1-like 5' DNA nuclease